MRSYMVFDTETGGFDPKTDALLSLAFVPVIDGKILRDKALYLRIQAGDMKVSKEAIAVNKLDPTEGITRAEAAKQVLAYVQSFGNKHVLVGHNVSFDVGFLKELITEKVFTSLFGYHFRDTMALAAFVSDKHEFGGSAPLYPNYKLGSVAEKFQVTFDAHNALADANATATLFFRLLSISVS